MNKNTRFHKALPWAKCLLAFQAVVFAICFASCAPGISKNIVKKLPPLDESAEVIVYDRGDTVPEHSEVLGGIFYSRTGEWEPFLEVVKKEARTVGGNALEIQLHAYSNLTKRPRYAISAFILNVNDSINPSPLTTFEKKDFFDYVITNDGDSIPCNIVFESPSHLQFVYGYNRQGYRKSMSIPRSDIISYHIADSVAYLEAQNKAKNFFDIQFAVDGGCAFNGYQGNNNSIHHRILSKGFIGSGDVRFNIKNGVTLGIHYHYFNGKGTTHSSGPAGYISNGGHHVLSRVQSQFIAGSFGSIIYSLSRRNTLTVLLDGGCEIPRSLRKHMFSTNFLLGCLLFNESNDEYTIKGSTLGIGVYCGYDYMLTEQLAIGFTYGTVMGIPFNAELKRVDNLLESRKIQPVQIDIKAGLRYYL